MSENNFAASQIFRQLLSTTINAGALTCIDTNGYLVNAADTANFRFAGVNRYKSVALATGLTAVGDLAECNVILQGEFVAQLYKAGTNPDRILDPVYARSATAVQDATDATNDVYEGRILRFLRSANPADYKDDTYVTASCYVLVGFDATVQ